MEAAGAVQHPLHAQVVVARRRHQGAELAVLAARLREPVPVTSPQNRVAGANEVAGRSRNTEIQNGAVTGLA